MRDRALQQTRTLSPESTTSFSPSEATAAHPLLALGALRARHSVAVELLEFAALEHPLSKPAAATRCAGAALIRIRGSLL